MCKELFISQFLGPTAYVAVVYDRDAGVFYNSLFESQSVGGGIGYYLTEKGTPITPDRVRSLARQSEDLRAERYTDITEANWRELVGA